MPLQPKSFWPALAAFVGASFTYTYVVARGEGNAMDGARTRWQQQKMRGEQAISAHGQAMLEQEQKHSH
ncbi:hypothetical protein BCR34DRAFT_602548 [Clohesyomyces aquaticus]|uniref:Uncharacterized protein n=1 Tax=Clohesyomyces aquaticus TaxID=1231657 RepID=A0A1Y1ZJ16_9PLEO|nr:hypothetical protein BCR34DRAFT_602548 [Clohesyomyces aquaticus]